jgi:hypothetical protein
MVDKVIYMCRRLCLSEQTLEELIESDIFLYIIIFLESDSIGDFSNFLYAIEEMCDTDLFYDYVIKKKRLDFLIDYCLEKCAKVDSSHLINLLNTLANDPRGIKVIVTDDNL